MRAISANSYQYAFYVPWNPQQTVTSGDVNGDGIPHLQAATTTGNLLRSASYAVAKSASAVQTNTWTFLAGTFDATTGDLDLYVNGPWTPGPAGWCRQSW